MNIKNEISKAIGNNVELLPIFHTTKTENFKEIAKQRKLNKKYNEALLKDIVFFFYGRAMYSENGTKLQDVNNLSFLPVGICISNYNLGLLSYTAYAVDSGAFKKNRFEGKLPELWDISGMEIGKDQVDINKYIEIFYVNSKNYINDNATVTIDADSNEKKVFLDFLRDKSSSRVDGRSRTIELAIEQDVHLQGDIVLFVHNKMNNQIFFKEIIKDFISKGISVSVKKYYTVDQVSPLAAYSCLNGEVKRYMEELL